MAHSVPHTPPTSSPTAHSATTTPPACLTATPHRHPSCHPSCHPLQEALLELFGSGQASQLCDKLALYLHYLMDAGHVEGGGAGGLQRALGLAPQQVAMWQCQQLLDEARPGEAQDPLLQRACQLLAQHAGGAASWWPAGAPWCRLLLHCCGGNRT
jgi:hypothetical protein